MPNESVEMGKPIFGTPNMLDDFAKLINRYGIDRICNTPDFLLARIVVRLLGGLETLNRDRDKWWGFVPEIGNPRVEGNSEINPFGNCNNVRDVLYKFSQVCEGGPMTLGSYQKLEDQATNRIFDLGAGRG